MTIEFELKLQVPPGRRDALVEALELSQGERLPLEARYFDTPEGLLAANGLSLRVRREAGRWVQTLKADGASAVERLEHEVEREPGDGGAAPLPELRLHAGSPAGAALEAVQTGGGTRALQSLLVPRHATRIERRRRGIEAGASRIELAFDEGELVAGGRRLAVCELELELKAGPPAPLLALARRWTAEHGLWLGTVSKAQRGECLARGLRHGPAVKAPDPCVERTMTRDALLRAVVRNCLAQILPNASELAAGSDYEAHVHQLRVGLRRLRTVLREIGDFGAEVDPGWAPVLAEVFRRLGEHRDRTHVAGAIQPRLEAAGAPALAWPAPGAGDPDPGEAVRDARFQALLIDLLAFSLPPQQEGETRAGKPGKGVRKALRARLDRLHRRVVRDGADFTALEPEAQHRVRKRLKRLRYLGEFAAPLFGPRAAKAYLRRLRPAQEALGAHNDDAVALEAYRSVAQDDPRAWFAVGWLTARQPQTARECRDALRAVADAPRFWKKSGG